MNDTDESHRDGAERTDRLEQEIADALVISEAAVKQHLAHLYDKFGIHGGGERRRVRLANEALRRGAVTIAGLRQADASDAKRPR